MIRFNVSVALFTCVIVLPSFDLQATSTSSVPEQSRLSKKEYLAWQQHVMECDATDNDEHPCARCLAGKVLSGNAWVENTPQPTASDQFVLPASLGLIYLQTGNICKRYAQLLSGGQRKKMLRQATDFYEHASATAEPHQSLFHEAETQLLNCYINGEGVKPNYNEALRIINELQKQPDAPMTSVMRLGQILLLGMGLENYHLSPGYELLKIAANQTKDVAARQLACVYLSACANAGFLGAQAEHNDGTLYQEAYKSVCDSYEVKVLAMGLQAYKCIATAHTVVEVQHCISAIRKLFQFSMPAAARLLLNALLYRADLEAQHRVTELAKKNLEADADSVPSCDAKKDHHRVTDEYEPLTIAEKTKIAQELIAATSMRIFNAIGKKVQLQLDEMKSTTDKK